MFTQTYILNPVVVKTSLQQEIESCRQLLDNAISMNGNFTHPDVVKLSQNLDKKILEAQSQLMKIR